MKKQDFATHFGVSVARLRWGIIVEAQRLHPALLISGTNKAIDIFEGSIVSSFNFKAKSLSLHCATYAKTKEGFVLRFKSQVEGVASGIRCTDENIEHLYKKRLYKIAKSFDILL